MSMGKAQDIIHETGCISHLTTDMSEEKFKSSQCITCIQRLTARAFFSPADSLQQPLIILRAVSRPAAAATAPSAKATESTLATAGTEAAQAAEDCMQASAALAKDAANLASSAAAAPNGIPEPVCQLLQ